MCVISYFVVHASFHANAMLLGPSKSVVLKVRGGVHFDDGAAVNGVFRDDRLVVWMLLVRTAIQGL